MKVLLVEADYKNKYPPLGLMKISAYHKQVGDVVTFVKGKNRELRSQKWDRIYITTLFTFYWKKTVDTIRYYYSSVDHPKNIHVGGIMATLLADDLKKEEGISGITIRIGLLDCPNMLGTETIPVDRMTPDYDIIDARKNPYLQYEYQLQDSYITSATKGCIRNCGFCAVKKLEPEYCAYIDIRSQVEEINQKYGERRNLVLMDNNILASPCLGQIINDLIVLGFERGNYGYKKNLKKEQVI